MAPHIEFVTCTSCQFENHPFCRFCLACGLSLLEVQAIVRDPSEDIDSLDPTQGAAPPSQEARELVRKIAEGLGLEVQPAGNAWKIQVPLKGGRGQTVYVRFSGTDTDGDDVISFLSLAAPADPAVAHQLLKLNDSYHYCKVAAIEVQGHQIYGTVAKQLTSTADQAEIEKMLLEVARRADALEDRLRGGADDY